MYDQGRCGQVVRSDNDVLNTLLAKPIIWNPMPGMVPSFKAALRRRIVSFKFGIFTNLEPIVPSKGKSQCRVLSNKLALKNQENSEKQRALEMSWLPRHEAKDVKTASETPLQLAALV